MVDQVLALPEGTALLLLAPVVKERKGEHRDILEDLRSRGFVRARIDGKVAELEEPPKLDLRRKHSIDAVVDRFKVRSDMAQRLAESFETALKLGEGVARIAWMDDSQPELTFSDKFACAECGYSLQELEPRLFSFNNPSGACANCDGLGVKQFFDPVRLIVNPSLSLAGGAVRGWDRRNAYYFQLVQSLARHFKFDVETAWRELDAKDQQILLYGSGEESIEFRYFDGRGGTQRRRHPFEGILPNLDRRYKETESQTVREELSKYIGSKPCPECSGTRLNRAARHVFVADKALPDISRLAVGKALKFFRELRPR